MKASQLFSAMFVICVSLQWFPQATNGIFDDTKAAVVLLVLGLQNAGKIQETCKEENLRKVDAQFPEIGYSVLKSYCDIAAANSGVQSTDPKALAFIIKEALDNKNDISALCNQRDKVQATLNIDKATVDSACASVLKIILAQG